jgi:hypothetical protein
MNVIDTMDCHYCEKCAAHPLQIIYQEEAKELLKQCLFWFLWLCFALDAQLGRAACHWRKATIRSLIQPSQITSYHLGNGVWLADIALI